jgi:hypothetical protein
MIAALMGAEGKRLMYRQSINWKEGDNFLIGVKSNEKRKRKAKAKRERIKREAA